jgi:hypothetical protein
LCCAATATVVVVVVEVGPPWHGNYVYIIYMCDSYGRFYIYNFFYLI